MLLLKILFILLLLLFPFGEVLRFNLGNDIYFKPIDAVAICLLIWTTILYIKNKPFKSSLHWYFFLFPIIGLVSLAINSVWLKPTEFVASFLYLLRWVSYLSIFFAFIQFETTFKKKVMTILFVDGIVVLLLGYLQLFFYPSLRDLFYLGWDEHLYRIFSTFLDPNFVGAFFVLYLIFIAGLFFKNKNKMNKRKVIFYILLILATLIAIFLTYSRSVLLMLLVSGIIFFLMHQKRKYILFLLGAVVIFILIISPYFYIENLDLLRMRSTTARISTIQNAFTVIQYNPIIGVGFNSYHYAQVKYHLIKPTSPFPSHSAAGVDTSLLLITATTGVIGLFAYLYLLFHLFKTALKHKNSFSIIFFVSGVGLFINAFFNNSLLYPEIMLWMWIMAGLMYSND